MSTKTKSKPAARSAEPKRKAAVTDVRKRISEAIKELDEISSEMKAHAQPAKPAEPSRRNLREAETERQFKELQHLAKTFHAEFTLTDFEMLKTFKLILDRHQGCTTPVESFLIDLVHRYALCDDDGQGLTLDSIQLEMEQHLLDDSAYSRAIKDAHFVAGRYPLTESKSEADTSANQ